MQRASQLETTPLLDPDAWVGTFELAICSRLLRSEVKIFGPESANTIRETVQAISCGSAYGRICFITGQGKHFLNYFGQLQELQLQDRPPK